MANITKTQENSSENVKNFAFKLLEAGLSIIPCHEKQPNLKWADYQLKPMSALTFEKHYRNPIIAIAPTPEDGIECIDFDSKNYPEGVDIYQEFCSILLDEHPQLFSRLYIEKTQGGGNHIVYKVEDFTPKQKNEAKSKREQIRGVAYASRYELKETATGKKTIQPLAMIETRVHGGYFIVAPSKLAEGKEYTQVKGDLLDLPILTNEERNYLLDVCERFDDNDTKTRLEKELSADTAKTSERIQRQQTTKAPAESVKSFELFNSDHDALQMLLQMGCTEVGSQGDTVKWLRPGDTSSSHSGYYYPDLNRIYNFSSSFELPAERLLSPADIFCLSNGIDPDDDFKAALDFLRQNGYGKKPSQVKEKEVVTPSGEKFTKFWASILNNKGEVKIAIKAEKLVKFLQKEGFRRFLVSEEAKSEYKFIKDNVVYSCEDDDVFRFVYEFTEREELEDVIEHNGEIHEISNEKLLNYFVSQELSIKRAAKMLPLLEEKQFIQTSKKAAFIFFTNTAVKITKHGLNFIPYEKIPGLIWKSQIIKRKYTQGKGGKAWETFVKNVLAFPENYDTMRSAIGFLLHRHYGAIRKAIIFTDRFSNEDEANGGTGKSLLARGLSKMVSCANIPAKNWSPDKNFAFQAVNYEDHLVILNDIDKISFDRLYNLITDELQVEKKGLQSFSTRVKLLITTNHLFENAGDSSNRRKVEIEFGSHYNLKHTPHNDFGFDFFGEDMPEDEWDAFFTFNMECIQYHLEQLEELPNEGGLQSNETVSKEHKEKQMVMEVGKTLLEWLEDEFDSSEGFYNVPHFKFDYVQGSPIWFYDTKDIYNKYVEDNRKSRFKPARITFTKGLIQYLDFKKVKYERKNMRPPSMGGGSKKAVSALGLILPERFNNLTEDQKRQMYNADAPF